MDLQPLAAQIPPASIAVWNAVWVTLLQLAPSVEIKEPEARFRNFPGVTPAFADYVKWLVPLADRDRRIEAAQEARDTVPGRRNTAPVVRQESLRALSAESYVSALRYLTPYELDTLQLVSRHFRELINNRSHSHLPQRTRSLLITVGAEKVCPSLTSDNTGIPANAPVLVSHESCGTTEGRSSASIATCNLTTRNGPVTLRRSSVGSAEEMSQQANETPKPPANTRKRRHYSVEFKLKIVEEAKKVSVHSASRSSHVDRVTIRGWVKQEAGLKQLTESSATSAKRMRLSGAGRPLTFKDLDEQLAAWVRERRAQKLRVSRRLVQLQAEKIFNAEEDGADFKASRGWLEKFLARHNFRLRVPTSVCQKPPSDYAEKLAKFVVYLSRLRQENRFQSIYACDETAVWLDPAGGKCIDECGAKEVSVRTTGHDKMRVTVMLTARADGYKCKPYVLLPRKRPDPRVAEKFKHKLFLQWAGKVWMDDELTGDFLQRVLGSTLFGKRLLVWDAFRCHISEATKKRLRELKIYTAVVPGGCTKFVQPADVSWNGPFKARIKHLHDVWMSTGDRMEWTEAGNPRAPSMDVYLDWIIQAWEAIPKEAIIKSFKDCGVTVSHDGSEDGQIHCFKPHGPAPEGRLLLRDERQAAARNDPFEEEADGEEDERNGYVSDDSLESV